MSVTAAGGFTASGVACGIKPFGALDLAIVAAERPVPVAAVFTVNTAAAAPVRLSRRHLAVARVAKAVVINSGCANAATGAAGDAAALATAAAVSAHLEAETHEVLVASTGTIGTALPVPALLSGVGDAVAQLGAGDEAGLSAARAIMTTDSVPKETLAKGEGYLVGGMVKGAGMIRPDMATMIAVLTTDAVVDAADLDIALRSAVDESFHSLNIDGCPSTNDTVIVLASGASGVTPTRSEFGVVLAAACRDLARQLAADAEGASRVVSIVVSGAADDATTRRAGRAMADSALVRASFYGGDANWGRLVGALGASDVAFDPGAIGISFAGVTVAESGIAVPHSQQPLLDTLERGDFEVAVSIGDGPGAATVLTTELTPDYVRFNGERS
jgi:glutamate N-acetyltransferase/amino-acid N-acetyltransferase